MFGSLFNKKIKIFSPVDGNLISLSNVSDEVFSKKIIGDGLAINPSSDTIKSPVLGTIKTIFHTNHAFTVIDENDIEIIVHIGIDTIDLKGEGFKRLINENTKVKQGTPILKINLDLLKIKAKNLETPVLITNMDKISNFKVSTKKNVRAGIDEIITCTLK